MSIKLPRVGLFSGRFADASIEASYRLESQTNRFTQTGWVMVGFSLAWLASCASDLTYLRGTGYFAPVIGSRLISAFWGMGFGAFILLNLTRLSNQTVLSLLYVWVFFSTCTAMIVSSVYPFTSVSDNEAYDVLVFNTFWMSIQILGLGAALSYYSHVIKAASAAYALSYIINIVYWTGVLGPLFVGPSIVLVTACFFANILSISFSIADRRRYFTLIEYQRAREAATRAQEFSNFLLTATGHNIRQPIYALELNFNAINALIESNKLEKVPSLLNQQRILLRSISSMVSSIVDLAHQRNTADEGEHEPLELNAFFTTLKDTYQVSAANADLEIRFVDTALSVSTDRAILMHIASNLIDNALIHSEADRLLIGARRRGGQIAVCFIDNGRGLPTNASQRRLDKVSPRSSGLGSGLVARLAELGELEIKTWSEPGKGVAIEVLCPVFESVGH